MYVKYSKTVTLVATCFDQLWSFSGG